MTARVKLWGVRGSIPAPGFDTARYGGNTTCIEYEADDGTTIILGSGSGIRELGFDLIGKKKISEINILISHTHWDHIQGFPFFVPIYIPVSNITVRAPVENSEENNLQKLMGLQLKHEYFPVTAAMLEKNCAKITYIDQREGKFQIGGVKVIASYVKHPILCLGYRLEYKDTVVVFTGDNEPYTNIFENAASTSEPETIEENDDDGFGGSLLFDDDVDDDEAVKAVEDMNNKFINFCSNADVLICDAQYTPEEYKGDPEKGIPGKENWGHTPMDIAVENAKKANAKRVYLTHHEPTRKDDDIDKLKERFRNYAVDIGFHSEVNFAAEKMEINI